MGYRKCIYKYYWFVQLMEMKGGGVISGEKGLGCNHFLIDTVLDLFLSSNSFFSLIFTVTALWIYVDN